MAANDSGDPGRCEPGSPLSAQHRLGSMKKPGARSPGGHDSIVPCVLYPRTGASVLEHPRPLVAVTVRTACDLRVPSFQTEGPTG